MSETLGEQYYADVEKALLARWPESKIDPTLDRIRAVCDLLGEPQRAYPVIHLTGTNGKTSTARMIDTLLRGLGLRTGRFTSPHLEQMTERITVDGAPLIPSSGSSRSTREVIPYVELVDARSPNPLSFFETITAMAFAAFADAPVDVAVLEVGLGGTWDVTNVADAAVAVVTPVGVDHARLLGNTPAEVAVEKAGIIKAGSVAILAQQEVDVAEVLLRRVVEVGATVAREGIEFGVVAAGARRRRSADLDLRPRWRRTRTSSFRSTARTRRTTPPARSRRSRRSRAARRSRAGSTRRWCGRRFAEVTSPGRLEIVRRSPTVIIDAAHNPHGARAAAQAIQEEFAFSPLIGVARRDGRQGRRRGARGLRAGARRRSSAPRTRRPSDAGRGRSARSPRDLRRPIGSRSCRGSTTRSSGASRWPSRASATTSASAAAASWSPARSSPPARRARCCGRRADAVPRRMMCASVLRSSASCSALSSIVLITRRGRRRPATGLASGSGSRWRRS